MLGILVADEGLDVNRSVLSFLHLGDATLGIMLLEVVTYEVLEGYVVVARIVHGEAPVATLGARHLFDMFHSGTFGTLFKVIMIGLNRVPGVTGFEFWRQILIFSDKFLV